MYKRQALVRPKRLFQAIALDHGLIDRRIVKILTQLTPKVNVDWFIENPRLFWSTIVLLLFVYRVPRLQFSRVFMLLYFPSLFLTCAHRLVVNTAVEAIEEFVLFIRIFF